VIAAETVFEDRLLLVGGVLLLGVLAALVARRLRLPVLVAFLGVGMLLGSEGIGGIEFDDPELARTIGVIGLVAIVFEGGLTTSWGDIRPIAVPAALLSTVAVIVTAALTGLAAYLLFDLSPAAALLLGAVVGSTDAAAVFATLRFTTLRRRVAALLEAESGANDPMAVALTLGLIAWITESGFSAGDGILLLLRQLGLGLVIGVGLGLIVRKVFPLLPAELAPFAPVASLATAAFSYGIADSAGASGFLAVYIVALWLGNTPMAARRSIVAFHTGLAFISQIVLFVVLGLLVFPSHLGPVVLSALALTAVLSFVARPVAVWLSTAFLGFDWRERLLVSWAGLRGAVPIVLATFAQSAGVGASDTIFNAIFFVVILSALIQGPTLEPVARRLGLTTEARPFYQPPLEVGAVGSLGADILEHLVSESDAVVGTYVRDTGLPRTAIIVLIVRDEAGVPPRGSTRVEAGDRLYTLARADVRRQVEALLDQWERGPMPAPLRLVDEQRSERSQP
jgi:cell volume regulation protein A